MTSAKIQHDQRTAHCRLFTFKEGLLSAVAHDLEIEVGRFEMTFEGGNLSATFDARSLTVLHAMADGHARPDALSARDKEKIAANIQGDVLDTKHHPEIRFVAVVPEGIPTSITGSLEIKGRKHSVTVLVHPEGERLVGEVTLHQPDFGITPYSAMLGTLRIKPDVRVRIDLPRP